MKTRRLTTCMVLIALVAVLATTPVWAADTVKLAVMEPLSGTFKDIGDRYLEGVQYAAEVLNAKGGINGQKVEIIAVDSELKPAVATTKATKLILTEGVKYFCGGTGSSVAGAMEVLTLSTSLVWVPRTWKSITSLCERRMRPSNPASEPEPPLSNRLSVATKPRCVCLPKSFLARRMLE